MFVIIQQPYLEVAVVFVGIISVLVFVQRLMFSACDGASAKVWRMRGRRLSGWLRSVRAGPRARLLKCLRAARGRGTTPPALQLPYCLNSRVQIYESTRHLATNKSTYSNADLHNITVIDSLAPSRRCVGFSSQNSFVADILIELLLDTLGKHRKVISASSVLYNSQYFTTFSLSQISESKSCKNYTQLNCKNFIAFQSSKSLPAFNVIRQYNLKIKRT